MYFIKTLSHYYIQILNNIFSFNLMQSIIELSLPNNFKKFLIINYKEYNIYCPCDADVGLYNYTWCTYVCVHRSSHTASFELFLKRKESSKKTREYFHFFSFRLNCELYNPPLSIIVKQLSPLHY